MGRSRPRAAERRVLGQGSIVLTSDSSLSIPPAPVYYPTEDEFKDPLAYIYKIKPEAEKFGIRKIIPPQNWKSPFALDLDKLTFPTKTQAIHQLQARAPACNSKTFELDYNRFLEEHRGKKAVKKKVVFEGSELDLCKLFNGVKRYGGYDNVVKGKKWGEVFRFVRSDGKISECSKYVLSRLYHDHLYDYESHCNKSDVVKKSCKRNLHVEKETEQQSCKKIRIDEASETVELDKVENQESYDQLCEQCGSDSHAEVMLLCDRCNKGWHIYCLSPPLVRVPTGKWYCSECFNSEKDSFGFPPGKQLSLEAFKRVADRANNKWFGSTSASRVQLEKKFWEIVEGSVGEVEVIYGSDLDTSVYGSGFPHVNDQKPSFIEDNEWDQYCSSPWNLNNLPKLEGSLLRAVDHNIPGIMVPWLYIGMLFSSFCWHIEDHCFYSMNYHHWGEPKCWYGVPGSEASAFEKVMRNSLPDLFDAQPDLLFQLVTMLNPSVLQANNVPVYSVLQEPGNFVITFPRSYHGGFNFGLNCAEAVNFATADWLPYGGIGAELYQHYHRPAVLSHEELLCVAAKNKFNGSAVPYLNNELLRVYNKEKSRRERLWKNGIINSSQMAPRKQPNSVGVEEDATCIICQQFLYLSAVGCSCRPSAFVCLEHSENLCECKPHKRHFYYRHTLSELNEMHPFQLWVQTVKSCISEKSPGVIDINIVNNLKSEIVELEIQVPEVPLFMDFVKQVELCQSRCTELLRGPITLENLEVLIQEYDGFTVNVPELKLLKQYHSDAFHWISYFNNTVKDIHEREDQETVVNELICLKKDGSLLKAQVDELHLVDVESKKASCRVEAWKVLRSKIPLESIKQVMTVATELQIENEKVFKKVSDVLAQVVYLEEKAQHILACGAQMSEFEDLVRMSEDLCALIPSLLGVQKALSMTKSWLIKSKPYLVSDLSVTTGAISSLKVDNLKELVSESKLLKIYLEERVLLFDVLQRYMQWERNACFALKDAESLLNILDVGDDISSDIISKVQDRVTTMEPIMKNELSLRFDSRVIPKFQETIAILHWCSKAFMYCGGVPTIKEVEMLLEDAKCHDITYAARPFWRSLVDAVKWLKQAVEILSPCNTKRFNLNDVEEALRQSKMIKISFPLIIDQLLDAIKRHNEWVDETKAFFSHNTGDRSLPLLLQLESSSSRNVFICTETDLVLSEVRRVKEWKRRAATIIGIKVGDNNLLLDVLSQILDTINRSLYMYDKPDGCNQINLCMFCSKDSHEQELLLVLCAWIAIICIA